MAAAFSIRAYAESMRGKMAAELGPFGRDLPPMEARSFRWWEDELAAIKASEAEEEEVAAAREKGKEPKKRSISDLFAAAPPVVDPSSGPAPAGEDDEVLGVIVRRAKELRRRRRVEAEAAAAAAAAAAPPSVGGSRRESSPQKALDETNLQDEQGIDGSSEEPEAEQNFSSLQKKVLADPNKEKKSGKISNLQKNKSDKVKYMESRNAIKVAKQRDLEKLLPPHSILKKYTKHTSVKVVKEKHGNQKRAGVIELCRKSVKRVKFSEAKDILGNDKQSSKTPQLESLCKLFSDASTSSSSSTDMSSEVDRQIAAESTSSHIPEKAFTKSMKANENTDQENGCIKVSNSGSSVLFDLNQALPESTDFDDTYISNAEGPSVEHTQDVTFSLDEQIILDHGRGNQKHATDLDVRAKGKSPHPLPNRNVHDSVQLQQSLCPMTLHHGVSQLSTGGEIPSSQSQGFNLPHSGRANFGSEINVQQESWSAAGQTFRLMGKDLTVSTTRVSYLAETSQKHTSSSDKDNLNAKMVSGLPRQGQTLLSLQAPSIPIVSVNSTSTVRDSANPPSKIQAQFAYRTPHSFSQRPYPTASFFSGDPSPYEHRFRNSGNTESRRNVLIGYPAPPNQGSEAFSQSSRAPWQFYSDHSTVTESPSEQFNPTQYSGHHTNLPQPYGVCSARSSVLSHNYVSITQSNPERTVQGVSNSRVSSALRKYTDTRVARAVPPERSNASSSSRQVLRSGPVKLSAGAKHILMPSESTAGGDAAPLYSCVSFGSNNRNVSAPQAKGADFRKL